MLPRLADEVVLEADPAPLPALADVADEEEAEEPPHAASSADKPLAAARPPAPLASTVRRVKPGTATSSKPLIETPVAI
jgi:hypothetical protein